MEIFASCRSVSSTNNKPFPLPCPRPETTVTILTSTTLYRKFLRHNPRLTWAEVEETGIGVVVSFFFALHSATQTAVSPFFSRHINQPMTPRVGTKGTVFKTILFEWHPLVRPRPRQKVLVRKAEKVRRKSRDAMFSLTVSTHAHWVPSDLPFFLFFFCKVTFVSYSYKTIVPMYLHPCSYTYLLHIRTIFIHYLHFFFICLYEYHLLVYLFLWIYFLFVSSEFK